MGSNSTAGNSTAGNSTAGIGDLWTVGRALMEVRTRTERALGYLTEVVGGEADADVLSMDSVRQMEFIAEVAHRLALDEMHRPPATDFGAVDRLHEVLYRALTMPRPAEQATP